ncbi:Transmembrane 9 superfamily member 3 [Spatholobus suberectus]|nr:Transmembrane 9 superfamily member 3 [Spatholobus suberectus]
MSLRFNSGGQSMTLSRGHKKSTYYGSRDCGGRSPAAFATEELNAIVRYREGTVFVTKELCFEKLIHCDTLKLGFNEGNVHVQSALIDLYGKRRDIESSIAVFECLPKRILECFNRLWLTLLRCGGESTSLHSPPAPPFSSFVFSPLPFINVHAAPSFPSSLRVGGVGFQDPNLFPMEKLFFFSSSLFFLITTLAALSTVRSDPSDHRYKDGETVPLYANKVGPFHNPSETYRYFDLPFCLPDDWKEKKEALGEVLNGDRLVSAPYKLEFQRDKELVSGVQEEALQTGHGAV